VNPAGEAVLVASVLFLGLSLLGLLGRAHRSNLIAAWVAMAGFAGLASFCFWQGVELKRSAGPAIYPIPTDPPGSHSIMIQKLGVGPGFRCRLVSKKDGSFDPTVIPRLDACRFRIPFCINMALGEVHAFDSDGGMELKSGVSAIGLKYETTPETIPLLQQLVVEVTCPPGFQKVILEGPRTLNNFKWIYVGGLFLATFGAGNQRRRMRRLRATDPAPSTSGPPAP
jgi:hypothetical protein